MKRPERELKGFEKVNLAPGETKHVTLSLDARLQLRDESKHNWIIDPGKFVSATPAKAQRYKPT
jgi:beta-glucosidase